MINYFKNIVSPKVQGTIEFEEFIERTKSPSNQVRETIEIARELHERGDKEGYDQKKMYCLPCYTFNFLFNGRKKDVNIVKPTGLIYLDLDNQTEIDTNHELIHATWRSLSNTGRGIVVKVKNLTKDNFKDTYLTISEELGIHSDPRAMKATQYNVQSHDPEVYYNPNSKVWYTNDTSGISNNKVVISLVPYKKKRRVESESNNTLKEKNDVESETLKTVLWSNLDEIEFNGHPFVFFEDEKYEYAKAFVPPLIRENERNARLFSIGIQIRALNPSLPDSRIRGIVLAINSGQCKPPLEESEVDKIIKSICSYESVELQLNDTRRVIFNPDYNFSKKLKSKIVNRITAKCRRNKTIKAIRNTISEWSIEEDGVINISRLASKANLHRKTVSKYWHLMGEDIAILKKGIG